MKILRKKLVSIAKKDLDSISNDSILLNIVYYNNVPVFSKSPKSKNKIYLNSSHFLLKDEKYLEEIIIDKKEQPLLNLKTLIENRHNIKIEFTKIIYNYSNIYFVLVKLNDRKNFIEGYRWIQRFDFYKINTDFDTLDLFESIINNNSSKSPKLINTLDKVLNTCKYTSTNLKIYHIYNSMIGDYEIKIN